MLVHARFDGATLSDASFIKANLMKASMEGAKLQRSDLRGANLFGVASLLSDCSEAKFDGALRTRTQLGAEP